MSENLDLVRSIYADWGRGDFSSIGWADRELEWTAIGGPEPSSGRGLASFSAAWRDFLEAWGDYRVRADELRVLDAERVLVLLTARARGRASGLEAHQGGTEGANIFHVRGGKVTKLSIYWDRDCALADLGLKEWAASAENVEVVKRTFDALQHRDYAAAKSGFHADAVWQNTGDFPGPLRCIGPEAIVEFWTNLAETFDDSVGGHEIEQATSGGEVVILGLHSFGRGLGSGVPIDVRWAAAVQIRNSSPASMCMATGARPSKPWAWSSKRCHRKTWRSSRQCPTHGTPGTWIACVTGTTRTSSCRRSRIGRSRDRM